MQDVIVAKIQGDVADALDPRIILPIFVGEEDAISTLQFALFDEFSLLYLCARGDIEQFSCPLIEDILYE